MQLNLIDDTESVLETQDIDVIDAFIHSFACLEFTMNFEVAQRSFVVKKLIVLFF